MRRISQFVHHRSLTAAAVSLFFAFLAFALLPEYAYRLQQQGASFLTQAWIITLLGLLACAFTLMILLRDNRSGYPSFRCSLATLLWALACVPVSLLALNVIGGLFR